MGLIFLTSDKIHHEFTRLFLLPSQTGENLYHGPYSARTRRDCFWTQMAVSIKTFLHDLALHLFY